MSARLAQQQTHQSSPSMESKWGDQHLFWRLISSSQTWAEQYRTWQVPGIFSPVSKMGGMLQALVPYSLCILHAMYWSFLDRFKMFEVWGQPIQPKNATKRCLNSTYKMSGKISRFGISWFHPLCAQAPWISHCRCLGNSAHSPNWRMHLIDGLR